jgi:hypothetical protein
VAQADSDHITPTNVIDLGKAAEARMRTALDRLFAVHADMQVEAVRIRSLMDANKALIAALIDELDVREDADAEPDADAELTAAENHGRGWTGGYANCRPDDTEEDDPDGRTAPERHGMGFVRCADDDCEASLGALEQHPSCYGWDARSGLGDQTKWGLRGGHDDREGDEHDGAEPDEDGEPSLGAGEVSDAADLSVLVIGWNGKLSFRSLTSGDLVGVDQEQWSEGVDAYRLDVEHDESDIEATAPERHGKGFVGRTDDNERELDMAEQWGIGDMDGAIEQGFNGHKDSFV